MFLSIENKVAFRTCLHIVCLGLHIVCFLIMGYKLSYTTGSLYAWSSRPLTVRRLVSHEFDPHYHTSST